tara:strand:- start:842 stop:1249 length:408 start_codon:yes stop_codon:yes gene_type:complete
MLYFAYGSNLNHHQMKNIRCVGSKYLKTIFLKDYKLSFCHPNKLNKYGYANIFKKRGSKVPGAIWQITKKHEKILDRYEEFPRSYQKQYFYLNGEKIMFYIMNVCFIKKPPKSYINTIKEGYRNCNIDIKYTNKF